MDPRGFCTQTRVLIVAGKGGVGKTTVAAAVARLAAGVGLTALVIEVEGRNTLAGSFDSANDLAYDEVELFHDPASGGRVRARTITPDDALLEWLDLHGMRRISRRLVRTGAVDLVATAAPGIKDILVLGKVKQLERAEPRDGDQLPKRPDVIVIDAPAAGHAVTFLQSARGLLDAVRVGPIRSQAQEVADLLQDPARCQVVLVTLPEETPVNELIETAYRLEDRVGIQLGPVVVNGRYEPKNGLDVDPATAAKAAGVELDDGAVASLRAAAEFRLRRQQLQASQIARLADALPLPQVVLPFVFAARIGAAEIDRLAAALEAQITGLPDAVRPR